MPHPVQSPVSAQADVVSRPGFSEALRFWLWLGCVSFGGPAGQISLMHRELVERRKWLKEDVFFRGLNFCVLLPGPEAQQLATYVGWCLHGTRGALTAGTLFVAPAAILLWFLSLLHVFHGHSPWIAAVFQGLAPGVLAAVIAASVTLGCRMLRTRWLLMIAVLSLLAGVTIRSIPFSALFLLSGIAGWFLNPQSGEPIEVSAAPSRAGWAELRILVPGAILWWMPVVFAGLAVGWDHVWVKLGNFFGTTALFTFGGAYSILPHVARESVDRHHWISSADMMDGLAMAEVTPGPLIMVLQFIGFQAGWGNPGPLSPLGSATIGAAITTWTTFVPSFVWILAGAPWVERIASIPRLAGAMSGITAAAVGMILSLGAWMAVHLFRDMAGTSLYFNIAVCGVCTLGLLGKKQSPVPWLAAAAVAGVARHALS